jgi:hypothetical protein
MTMGAVDERVAVAHADRIRITFAEDEELPAEMLLNTLTAAIDLVAVAWRIEIASQGLVEPRLTPRISVSRVHYGSPLDIVLMISGASASVVGLALLCTKVAEKLVDIRLKLAQSRKIVAETDQIRIDQARESIAENWRLKAAEQVDLDAGVEELGYVVSRRLSPGLKIYGVSHVEGSPLTLSGSELDDLRIIQAENLVNVALARLAIENFKADPELFPLSGRELRSLVIISGTEITIRIDSGDPPGAEDSTGW